MTQWIRRGLATGIKTTRYPDEDETAAGVSPGLPIGGRRSEADTNEAVAVCPTGAIGAIEGQLAVDYRRCVHCYRCARAVRVPVAWKSGYEWAATSRPDVPLGAPFERSVHILVVDAGDCGACLNEVRQLSGPYYNIHRLGFFITPTPRLADVLLVVGPVTDHMRLPLQKAYDAMPNPKRVIAAGACALSGGVFGPSFVSGSGARDVVPIDVEVPGNPPPPLAILHGLLVAVGRKCPVQLISPEGVAR